MQHTEIAFAVQMEHLKLKKKKIPHQDIECGYDAYQTRTHNISIFITRSVIARFDTPRVIPEPQIYFHFKLILLL